MREMMMRAMTGRVKQESDDDDNNDWKSQMTE